MTTAELEAAAARIGVHKSKAVWRDVARSFGVRDSDIWVMERERIIEYGTCTGGVRFGDAAELRALGWNPPPRPARPRRGRHKV